MIKIWKVRAELFWDASREESFIVKANTQRKAVKFATEEIKKKYPDIGIMINIRDVNEVTTNDEMVES